MSELNLLAPAKINLTLEILGKRPDQFHDLTSIIVSVNLCDEIKIEESSELEIFCSNILIKKESNLAYLVANALRNQYKISTGAKITLSKNIPVTAGLGGGSSDAATTLIGLNKLWGLGLKIDQLSPIARSFGSDITFFLHNGTAMVQGKGDIIRTLPQANIKYAVILSPDIPINNKTRLMFSKVTSSHYTNGAWPRNVDSRIRSRGDIPPELLFNVFDPISSELFPELKSTLQIFSEIWSEEIHICGAGPSLFTLVESREIATALSLLLNKKTGFKSYVVEPTKAVEWN